jgi:hypothetical protein
VDLARLRIPAVQAAMLQTPLGYIMRDDEKRTCLTQLFTCSPGCSNGLG